MDMASHLDQLPHWLQQAQGNQDRKDYDLFILKDSDQEPKKALQWNFYLVT